MEETGTDTMLAAARRMLDIFASVGADRFHVTWTNSAGHPRRPHGLRRRIGARSDWLPQSPGNPDWLDTVHIEAISFADIARIVPAMLETASIERLNLIIRPDGSGVSFLQLDDLSSDKLPPLAPAVFLILETSPGNFQAWLGLPGILEKDFAHRVRRGTGADATASGATRIAGSFNFKEKYAPNFPRVQIRSAQSGYLTTTTELEQLGVIAPPDQFPPLPVMRVRPSSARSRPWPDYTHSLERAPLNSEGTGPDTSRADIVWCMTAITWGFEISETAARLIQEPRSKAHKRGETYALATVRKAAVYVEQRKRPPKS
jgi:hypothetical protein